MEKRTKVRGPGCPWWTRKTNQTSTAAHNINEWILGLKENASEVEMRNHKVRNHGTEQRNAHSQHVGRSRRWCRRQSTPQLPKDTSGGTPSSGGGSSNQGSEWSFHQWTMMRGSRESNQAGSAGRGLRVKVNLPIFKDEKTKDTVTYHSWWWDIAIFCPSGWGDWHLLPYLFQSLQGFPGDLARSLGEDATITDVLQKLDKHYGMVMMFDPLRKELYSLKQGSWENVAEFRVHLSQQVQILKSEYLGRIQQEQMEEMEWDCFYKGLNPKYWHMWLTKWMVNPLLATPTCSLWPGSWKDGQKLEIPCSQRPPQLKDQMLPGHSHLGTCFPLGSWRAIVPSWLTPP